MPIVTTTAARRLRARTQQSTILHLLGNRSGPGVGAFRPRKCRARKAAASKQRPHPSHFSVEDIASTSPPPMRSPSRVFEYGDRQRPSVCSNIWQRNRLLLHERGRLQQNDKLGGCSRPSNAHTDDGCVSCSARASRPNRAGFVVGSHRSALGGPMEVRRRDSSRCNSRRGGDLRRWLGTRPDGSQRMGRWDRSYCNRQSTCCLHRLGTPCASRTFRSPPSRPHRLTNAEGQRVTWRQPSIRRQRGPTSLDSR